MDVYSRYGYKEGQTGAVSPVLLLHLTEEPQVPQESSQVVSSPEISIGIFRNAVDGYGERDSPVHDLLNVSLQQQSICNKRQIQILNGESPGKKLLPLP